MPDAHGAPVSTEVRKTDATCGGSHSSGHSPSGNSTASEASHSTTMTSRRSSIHSSSSSRASHGGRRPPCDKGDPMQWSREVVDAMATRRSGHGWDMEPARDGHFGCKKHFVCRQHMLQGEGDDTPCEEFPECRSCSVCTIHDEYAEKVRDKRKSMGRAPREDWRAYIIGLREVRGQRAARPPFLDASDNRALRILKSLRDAAEEMEFHGTHEFTVRDFHHTLFVSGAGPQVSMTMMQKMYRKWCEPAFSGGRRRSHESGVLLPTPERKNILSTTQVIKLSTRLILNLEYQAVHGSSSDSAASLITRCGVHLGNVPTTEASKSPEC
eukprot:GEMP01062307.1.p1 GENE.GEMP01062307.1~~GEMP01062307.1.p1  ORF type:complete len:326 (+),score=96.01 GEMP01062307.1:206-1183(+)